MKNTEKPKKKKGCLGCFTSVVLFSIICGLFSMCTGYDGSNSNTVEPTKIATVAQHETAATQAEALAITLIADEQGEYGELFTLNAGTEFEETYYIYRVPTGTYTVTLTGKYMDQFNVYGETVYITESGYEELSDVYYVKLFQPGESDTVTIEDGQIIEIHGNGVWELTLN